MTLKDMIVLYRSEHGLSQRQFAQACGLSNGYISMIEREENPQTGEKIIPTLQALQKLAIGMHITLTDLLTSIDDMPVDISFKPVSGSGDGLDSEIVALIHTLTPERKRDLIRYLRFLASCADD